MQKKVFAIGLDPDCADFSGLQNITPELVRVYIHSQLERVRAAGYAVDEYLIRPGINDGDSLADAMQAGHYDCIMIGAGRRANEHIVLFEKTLNLAHRYQPRAKICFNTSPADTLEAVQRWM